MIRPQNHSISDSHLMGQQRTTNAPTSYKIFSSVPVIPQAMPVTSGPSGKLHPPQIGYALPESTRPVSMAMKPEVAVAIPSRSASAQIYTDRPKPPPRKLSSGPVRNSKMDLTTNFSFGTESINYSNINIPFRQASIQDENLDQLINAGNTAVLHPNCNMEDALQKWRQALLISEKSHDLISCAKILSNISCIYKNQGKYNEAHQYIRKSWVATSQYINLSSSSNGGSTWLQIAIRALDLKSGTVENDFATFSSEDEPNKSKEYCNGPPIIMWLFQLTNNIGNIQYALGDYEMAIRSYDTCLALVDTTLEEFPLPQGLMPISASANPLGSNLLKNVAGTGSYKLSTFHRQAVLAQARCLTHLGVCFLALGASTTSLQYHLTASSFIAKMSARVPSLTSPGSFGTRTSSTSVASRDLTDFVTLEAAIASNLAAAWFKTGDIGKSIASGEKSLKLFDKLKNKSQPSSVAPAQLMEENRQAVNRASIYIHIGRCINAMMWSRHLQSQEIYDTEPSSWSSSIEETKQDPESDQLTPLASKGLLLRALRLHLEHGKKQYDRNDRFGLVFTYLNIGTDQLTQLDVMLICNDR
jgi:tetratricopeptide (TPR) repeat protein